MMVSVVEHRTLDFLMASLISVLLVAEEMTSSKETTAGAVKLQPYAYDVNVSN